MLTVGSVTGLLEIDRAEERMLGVDTSFWIAVALTYLEFLEEREVCLTLCVVLLLPVSDAVKYRVIWLR
jgi:hypothetical protein